MAKKIAVVLFNLGGPDGPADVKPFLFNLFRDPAIINLPNPARWALAKLISTTREAEAAKNYAEMGGGSPLRPETEKQAAALETALNEDGADEWKCFIGMRYWKPFIEDAALAVRDWGPDEVVLLPLYPHFSITTTETALTEWDKRYKGGGERRVCCYPFQKRFLDAHAKLIRQTWEKAGRPEKARLLYSAHGLPEKTVACGDPYPAQIAMTAEALSEKLPELPDWKICYQSRVGPLKWIGPSTEEAIDEAIADGESIILSPIAFVSEHIETLVELDIEYGDIAREKGAPGYHRVPALGAHPDYIAALAELARGSLTGEAGVKPPEGRRICPPEATHCPCRSQAG